MTAMIETTLDVTAIPAATAAVMANCSTSTIRRMVERRVLNGTKTPSGWVVYDSADRIKEVVNTTKHGWHRNVDQPNGRDRWTASQVAAIAGCSYETIRRMGKRGELNTTSTGLITGARHEILATIAKLRPRSLKSPRSLKTAKVKPNRHSTRTPAKVVARSNTPVVTPTVAAATATTVITKLRPTTATIPTSDVVFWVTLPQERRDLLRSLSALPDVTLELVTRLRS
jgi:hypothetical protein